MTAGVYDRYFWDVLSSKFCFNENIFKKKLFWQSSTSGNTGIHDPFNKFNFLKTIKDIVSVAESGYL